MKILITGGCGFLGSNLACRAIGDGHDVVVFDNLYRVGSVENLQWLKTQGKFEFVHGDVRNKNDIERTVMKGFDAVFHVAGQVAMTTSIENPAMDFEVNAFGVFNLLDAVRKYSKDAVVLFSSTNKVYGDLEQYAYTELDKRYVCDQFKQGFDESVPLQFSSPYGCSKGCADQYMQDFYKTYGVNTVVFRHSSMFGGRQFATTDQGWIGWFVEQAFVTKQNSKHTYTICGNGKQVRDVLYASDVVDLYFECVKQREKVVGGVYNIGGGMKNSLSLLELFDMLEDKLKVKMNYTKLPARLSDQKVFVADISKIEKLLNWSPKIGKNEGLDKMIEWMEGHK